MKNLKKIVAGASLIASIAITNVDAAENNISQEERARIDREANNMLKELENELRKHKTAQKQNKRPAVSNEEMLVKEGLRELELEEQFKNSPYLYQKYNGYVDRYIKDAKKLSPEEAKKAAKLIAEMDEKYFEKLCENSYGPAHNSSVIFDTELKNGERHLVYNQDSYVFCGEKDSDVLETFRLNGDYCEANKSECETHKFGQDTVCSCKSDNDTEAFGFVSSLDKKNNKKIAMVQSILYVQGR